MRCFDVLDQRCLAALEEHAVAGARGIDLAATAAVVDRLRSRQPRPRQRHQRIAFVVGEETAEQHQARALHRQQHLHLAVGQPQHRWRAAQVGLGHRRTGPVGQHLQLWRHGCRRCRLQRLRQRGAGHDVIPAAGMHGLQDVVEHAAGPGLREDPFAQLRRHDLAQVLDLHAAILAAHERPGAWRMRCNRRSGRSRWTSACPVPKLQCSTRSRSRSCERRRAERTRQR